MNKVFWNGLRTVPGCWQLRHGFELDLGIRENLGCKGYGDVRSEGRYSSDERFGFRDCCKMLNLLILDLLTSQATSSSRETRPLSFENLKEKTDGQTDNVL
jgi:hypothetical protein